MVWKNVNCFNPTVCVTGGGGCSLLFLLLNVWLYVVLGLAALPVPVGPEPWRFVRPHGHQHEAVDGYSGRDQVCTWITTFHCNVHVGFSSSSNDRIRNAKSKIWKNSWHIVLFERLSPTALLLTVRYHNSRFTSCGDLMLLTLEVAKIEKCLVLLHVTSLEHY